MKPLVTREELELRVGGIAFPPVDAVVAIERGGRVPGELIAAMLDRPLALLRLAYRDDTNAVRHAEPQVLHRATIPCPAGSHILLVDDVSVSGATLGRATAELPGFAVTTFVLKGTADIVAFPELDACVTWPWTPAATAAGTKPVEADVDRPGGRGLARTWPLASRRDPTSSHGRGHGAAPSSGHDRPRAGGDTDDIGPRRRG